MVSGVDYYKQSSSTSATTTTAQSFSGRQRSIIEVTKIQHYECGISAPDSFRRELEQRWDSQESYYNGFLVPGSSCYVQECQSNVRELQEGQDHVTRAGEPLVCQESFTQSRESQESYHDEFLAQAASGETGVRPGGSDNVKAGPRELPPRWESQESFRQR